MSGINGIAAVVLNYKTWEDAVNCVNDLKAQDHPDKHIVVVENGSGNGSAVELKKRFNNDPLVTVLVSEKNLGFARGNNLGIRYAHEKLGYDTVFVVNSDVSIGQGLFSAVSSLDCSGVGTITPKVVEPDGALQYYPVNCDNIDRHARRTICNLLKADLAALPGIDRLYEKRRSRRGASAENRPQAADIPKKQYVLQGCAYFLAPDFFRHYRGIYPRTFLYWEEINLMLMLKRAGLRSIYADTPAITHFGCGSTKSVAKSLARFRLKHSNRSMLRSLPVILGMGEKRIARCIDNSPEFSGEL